MWAALPLLVLILLLAEAGLRLYLALVPERETSRYISDEKTLYRLRPGPFWEDDRAPGDIVNSFGFRDREHSIEKPAGTYRIVGIGDSFVLGAVPIEENFLRVAERMLNNPSPIDSTRVELMMMGLGGYGPVNELGVLKSTALKVEPDLVILCLYIGNDITGVDLRGEVLDGELYFVRSSNRLHSILRRSRLYVLAERAILNRWRLQNLERQRGVGSGERDTNPDDQPNLYYRLILKKRMPIYAKRIPAGIQHAWLRTEEVLEEFRHCCEEASIRWTLLLIPTEEQVDLSVRTAALNALSLDVTDYDFDLPQRRLRDFAASRGIDLLDLTPVFRNARQASERLYIPNDTHWNRAGNTLAAQSIDQYVRDRSEADSKSSAHE